jgi:hypothetical protein
MTRPSFINRMLGGLLPGLLLALMLVFPAQATQAQTASDATPDASPAASPAADSGPRFVIRPVNGADGDFFTLEAEAGTTNELTVVLGNADDEVLSLRTYANDTVPMTNGGFSIAEEHAEPTGTATWIDYEAETFDFEPGEGVERTFTVTIPEDAAPGQYIAGLALQTAEPLEVEGTSLFNQIIRKTIAVFIIVPGPEQPAFTLGEPELLTDGALDRIVIPVENSGNVLVKPQGELTLTDASGKTVVTAPIALCRDDGAAFGRIDDKRPRGRLHNVRGPGRRGQRRKGRDRRADHRHHGRRCRDRAVRDDGRSRARSGRQQSRLRDG